MIKEIEIKNFKSIQSQKIELGRFNVFIGENGCGKTNILEAFAMIAAAKSYDLSVEGLSNRGMRVTKPSLTFNSFFGKKQGNGILVNLEVILPKNEIKKIGCLLHCDDKDDILTNWNDYDNERFDIMTSELFTPLSESPIVKTLANSRKKYHLKIPFTQFIIYALSTNALRGITNLSLKQPLGINGEGLDLLLASFNEEEWEKLLQYKKLISWLDDIVLDNYDQLKLQGHKLGRSTSRLYFKDRFMQKSNNIFAAENANEGALHILFYLGLFISSKTPSFFGIDNIETALNPRLCSVLTNTLAELAKTNDKQALITTHNPAILDGLNLNDDDQRLFVVKRSDEGFTKVERIKLKPKSEEKLKLSEMWMRGYLGGIPQLF
ncbi:MAG: AAA family ATPase [Chitinophagales bacterium]